MFMGGFHAFPGGQLDRDDLAIEVKNCGGDDEAAMRACAVREFFEEAGVLLARGPAPATQSELAAMRQALAEKKISFRQALEEKGLEIDASALRGAGRWVTPPFAPRRFDTWFFFGLAPRRTGGPRGDGRA